MVTSYEQGGSIIASLNIVLNSHEDKTRFEAKIGGSYGNIFSASSKIESAARTLNMQGSVSISAYQIGGEPQKLINILGKSSSGDYYALTCDMRNMADCTKAANRLIDYVKNDFVAIQFKAKDGKVFGDNIAYTGKFSYIDTPVSLIPYNGKMMDSGKSFIDDPENVKKFHVKEYRENIDNEYLKYQYYQQKVHDLLYGYPIPLSSQFKNQATTLYNNAESNLELIDDEVLVCYSSILTRCAQVYENIIAKLKPITSRDLEFLNNDVKYIMPLPTGAYLDGSVFFKIFGTKDSWQLRTTNSRTDLVEAVSITNNSYTYKLYISPTGLCHLYGNLHSEDHISYQGTQRMVQYGAGDCSSWRHNVEATKQISPFYFEEYEHLLSGGSDSNIEYI